MADLWNLISGTPEIDPSALAEAIEQQVASGDLDYRTRLLIRDGTDALAKHWGAERISQWLSQSRFGNEIEKIRASNFDSDEFGFPSIGKRLMNATRKEDIEQYFTALGRSVKQRTKLHIGGSIALILPQYLSRHTGDIDVVDEIPAAIRTDYATLDKLQERFGLMLTHFQSHYLPSGWDQRLHFVGNYNNLDVYLVDLYDVVVGKLFSSREKDFDDLRLLKRDDVIEQSALVQRLQTTGQAFYRDEKLRKAAEQNWHDLFSSALPLIE